MENGHFLPLTCENAITTEYRLQQLATKEDTEVLCPIRYIHDYLPIQGSLFNPQTISLHSPFAHQKHVLHSLSTGPDCEQQNSICLDTQAARLPLYTGFSTFKQSRWWKDAEAAVRDLLDLIAQDERCQQVRLSDGQSMADLAVKESNGEIMDGYGRFSVYMFPEAGKERTELLAQCVLLTFAFDGKLFIPLLSFLAQVGKRSHNRC